MSLTFNTVLTPPAHIAIDAIEFAQKNFADNHMGYCLGSDGHLPHITLIQTTISNQDILKKLHNLIAQLKWSEDKTLKLDEYYHNTDKGYCGIAVELSDSLQKLHERVLKIHSDLNLEIHGDIGKNYWPHLTLAKTNHQMTKPVNLPLSLQSQSGTWRIEFGHMGEHGVYLGKYQP